MHGKALMVLVAVSLSLCFFAAPDMQAEIATQEEMELVCQNWLSYMVYQKGAWAGATHPQIVDVDEIVEVDTVLARCFSLAPSGFVVVPVLKELPPIKAYSEEYGLDVNERDGFPQLLREVLLHRTRVYTKRYGSLEAVQPITGDMPLGCGHRVEWNRFLKSQEEFKIDLTEGKFTPLTQAGPLLTDSWHQSAPYNNFCPMGDGGRCVVGCVATAAAQIMRYWNWPPSGTGSHSYTWDGDQSCEGDVGGGTLSATFSDPYDWQNMLDDYSGGSTLEEAEAVAELCYEVGVAFEMDYGACGSGAYPSLALTVFPTYFGYDSSIKQENRVLHTAAEWFSIIQTEINDGRPMHYSITQHSIVCDGWRDTGGQNQYHMNYGWGGPFTAWYTIDSLYCHWEPDSLCPPMQESLIRRIICEGGIPGEEDTLVYDDDTPHSYWRIPHERGHDLFNVRFTPLWDYHLKSAQFLFYYKTGIGAIRIYVWEDTGGYPAEKIDSVDVAHGNIQTYPDWTTIDFSSKNVILSSLSDFHIGYTPLGPPETDTVAIVSDDGLPPGTEHRSIEFYDGVWVTMYDDWEVDLNFMIRALVEKTTDVEEEQFTAVEPSRYELFQNYPNPFNPQTKVRYYLPKATWVTLTIHNVLGQRVRTLVDEYQNAGAKTLLWDGKDNHLKEVASGIYFYRLKTGEFNQTKKMVLIK